MSKKGSAKGKARVVIYNRYMLGSIGFYVGHGESLHLSYETAYQVLELPDDVELIVRWPDGNESVHHGPLGDKTSSPESGDYPQNGDEQ